MPSSLVLRAATPDDAPALARHRAAMWSDMGRLQPGAAYDAMVDATAAALARMLASGEYHAWVLCPAHDPTTIVAGAGLQLREQLPFPVGDGHAIRGGEQGRVLNVYTEPAWRRMGCAERLMHALLAWAEMRGLASVVLNASADGRPLYERLGFVPTNEMRYSPPTRG